MKIVQLTDLHIGREDEDTYGVDVRRNFREGLEEAKKHNPDLLVISGDLCFKMPDISIYEWIATQLKNYPISYELMVGNHDDLGMMRAVFPGIEKDIKEDGLLYFLRDCGGEKILFLDTDKGHIEAGQLQWLSTQLHSNPGIKVLFVHYPPFLAGVPFMDTKYPLHTRESIQKILLNYQKPLSVFTGHYHLEKTVRVGNIDQNITPSTFYQLDGTTPHFRVGSQKRGYRLIETLDDVVRSMVFYY